MNFNTLQYFQVFEENDMNNDQNAEILSLSNSKNDWFALCYALLDKDFDNKVYFANYNVKVFHHVFLYHCGYQVKTYLCKKSKKLRLKKNRIKLKNN